MDLETLVKNKITQEYEATILVHSYLNDEISQEVIKECESFPEDYGFKLIRSININRYDISFKKKKIKINMYTIYFEINKSKIDAVKKLISKNKQILKFLVIKRDSKLQFKAIDYKSPIEMKKYMFESMRIMPIELTRCTKKEQKLITINIQRARNLGLMDRGK